MFKDCEFHEQDQRIFINEIEEEESTVVSPESIPAKSKKRLASEVESEYIEEEEKRPQNRKKVKQQQTFAVVENQ